MISQKIQIAYHLDNQIRQITDLQNLSYVHKISKYDVNGNLVSWTSQLNSNTHVLQGFTTIEPNTAYIVESNSSALFPYDLFPDADNVVHDSDLLATSGHLETSLTQEMVLRDSIERDFSEAVFRDLLTASGDLNTEISDASGVLNTRIDSVENSLDARLDIVEHHFTVTATEGKYIFNGNGTTNAENPTLFLSKGETYHFTIDAKDHPFYIKDVPGITDANAYPGVINNGADEAEDVIIFTVPQDAPDLLYYNCQNHETMAGELKLSSGGGTGEGGSAGQGLVGRGGEIDLQNPKVDFSPLVSGVFAPDEDAANHLAREDLLTIFDSTEAKFKYTTLEDMINATYISLYDNDLRPEYIDGGGADEFGPFGVPNGGGDVDEPEDPVGNRPTITISSDVPSVSAGETATITFTLSEAASGSGAALFDSSDITVINGSISNFTGSGTSFTALFTPTENLELTQAVITVPQGSFVNSSGLSNTASELRINVDTTSITTPAPPPDKVYLYDLNVGSQASPGGLQARLLPGIDSTASISHNVSGLTNQLILSPTNVAIMVLDGGNETPTMFITYEPSIFNTTMNKEMKITIGSDSWDIVLDINAETDPSIYYPSTFNGIPTFVLVK